MATTTPSQRDVDIITKIRIEAQSSASYSFSAFNPALEAGIADTRDEYMLESWFISCGKLWELRLYALRVLIAPIALPYPVLNNHSDILTDAAKGDEKMRASLTHAAKLVEMAVAPLEREWDCFWRRQLTTARNLFEDDMSEIQDARARAMGIGAASSRRRC